MTRQNSFRLSRHWCWQRSRCQRTCQRTMNRERRFRIRKGKRRRIPWSPTEPREIDSEIDLGGGSRIMAESPDAPNTSPAPAAKAPPYVGSGAGGTSKAAASAGVAAVGPEDNVVNQRRRRLGGGSVTAFLTAWFLAFFSAPHSFRTSHRLQDRLSLRLRFGCGYEMAAEVSYLGGSQT